MQFSAFQDLSLINFIKGLESIRVGFEHCCKFFVRKWFIFLFGQHCTDLCKHVLNFSHFLVSFLKKGHRSR